MKMLFPSKCCKSFMMMFILFLWISGSDAFSADFFRYDHDICGKIVDIDTKKPVEGVVVSAVWFTEHFRLTIEPEKKYYDYAETLTNKQGEFRIPGKGRNIIRNIPPPTISIFKAGYSIMHLQDLGVYFKRDHPLSDEVKWVNGEPIIPFKKKSLEERKKYLHSHPGAPFSGMAFVGVPQEKIRLFSEELNRAYEAAGMTTTPLSDQRLLQYKEGGVFPGNKHPENKQSSR